MLDLTRVVAGPYCTQLLGDMGADVIKVEGPDGDLTRNVGPQRHRDMSANFLIFNSSKRSVELDLKTEEGRDALLGLARTCDVFVVNFRQAALEKLRITYDDLRQANPAIVYCRIVGFAPDSEYAHRPAIDDVVQAVTGIVDLQQRIVGEPKYVAFPVADLATGLFAVNGILAGVIRQRATGEGSDVEVRMYDAMAHFVLSPHLYGNVFEPPLAPAVYPRSAAPNKAPFRTADGWICVAPFSDRDWRQFFQAVGRADVLEDDRFSTVVARSAHLDDLYGLMRPILAERTTAEWLAVLEQADVPATTIRSVEDLARDPALEAAGVIQTVEHPTEGTLRLLANPVRFDGRAGVIRHLPPTRGRHTAEVLDEAGL